MAKTKRIPPFDAAVPDAVIGDTKTPADRTALFRKLQKRLAERILAGERSEHLGCAPGARRPEVDLPRVRGLRLKLPPLSLRTLASGAAPRPPAATAGPRSRRTRPQSARSLRRPVRAVTPRRAVVPSAHRAPAQPARASPRVRDVRQPTGPPRL